MMMTIAALILIAIAIRLQWKDCVRGYGNTMGVYSLIRTIWMGSGLCLGIGIAHFIAWYWAGGLGLALFLLSYPIIVQIEKLGVKYGPRQ